MSMQRVVNYGSFLQAYSLKKNIEQLGHTVSFVDYHPGQVLVSQEEVTEKKSIREKVMGKIERRLIYPTMISEKERLESEEKTREIRRNFDKYLRQLDITEAKNYDPDIDALVIGSDEVFNCLQTSPDVGYSKDLFGQNTRAGKILTFAASFGNTTQKGLTEYGIAGEIGTYLKRFDALSVRDKNSKEIVEGYGLNAEEHLDPVFLYDYQKEMENIETDKGGYIVVYSYSRRLSKEECRYILKFAHSVHKKVICLCGWQKYLRGYDIPGPFQVLSIIKNADYVITDTFHGAVFSIKFNRPFATFIREGYGATYGNSEKLADLLKRLHLESRIVTSGAQLSEILKQQPDFSDANRIIQENRERALTYLNRNLQENV
jgi:hypothetical protein